MNRPDVPTPASGPALSPDILPHIFQYLGEVDLEICLHVNRTFFELAGKELYGRDRYFGKERTDEVPENVRVMKMRVGLQSIIRRKKRPGVSKALLLGHVRHLSCFAHTPNYCYRYRHVDHNKLPHLQTLSLYQTWTFHDELKSSGTELPPYHFDCPFTRHLTPTHVILHDLPNIQPQWCQPIHFDTLFGNSVTSVTLYFYDILSFLSDLREYPNLPIIPIIWPQKLTHLHLVFRDRVYWGCVPRYPDLFGYPSPIISATNLSKTIGAVLELVLSAEHLRPMIKIEGLGGGFSPKTDQRQLARDLRIGLLDGYRQHLLGTGNQEEADKRMAQLDF